MLKLVPFIFDIFGSKILSTPKTSHYARKTIDSVQAEPTAPVPTIPTFILPPAGFLPLALKAHRAYHS
jgi:hypothetical protein